MPKFGMVWEVPKKPSIHDALVAVRLQARLDGILIPEDAEPTIAEQLPSDRNPNGSLDVIFEWGDRIKGPALFLKSKHGPLPDLLAASASRVT
jgi:hypothetical protein